jgi:hypothetical protein
MAKIVPCVPPTTSKAFVIQPASANTTTSPIHQLKMSLFLRGVQWRIAEELAGGFYHSPR